MEPHRHLKIILVLSSLLVTPLVALLTPLSVLALSEEKTNPKHKKQILSISFCRAVLTLTKLLLSKAALSLHPGLVWFLFLDVNLWTIWYLLLFKNN